MYLYLTLASLAVFITVYVLNKDLRKPMIWAGLLSFPLFILKLLVSTQFITDIQRLDLFAIFLVEAIIFGFTFGGVAAVLFEVMFHKKLKTVAHPHRVHLNWLAFGPLAFLISTLLIRIPFSISLAIGFIVQAAVLIYLRKDLLWDALLSGVFLGIVYLFFYYLFFTIIPGQAVGLWFTETTGIFIGGIPVEEMLVIFAFGMLWGPLYEGVKGLSLKDEK